MVVGHELWRLCCRTRQLFRSELASVVQRHIRWIVDLGKQASQLPYCHRTCSRRHFDYFRLLGIGVDQWASIVYVESRPRLFFVSPVENLCFQKSFRDCTAVSTFMNKVFYVLLDLRAENIRSGEHLHPRCSAMYIV